MPITICLKVKLYIKFFLVPYNYPNFPMPPIQTMPLSNTSMINYTYLNQYQAFSPQPQPSYNSYIPATTNKYSNQAGYFTNPSTQPIFNTIYPNKMAGQMPPVQNQMNTPNLPVTNPPAVQNVQPSLEAPVKKSINLNAQSFIPKGLKITTPTPSVDVQEDHKVENAETQTDNKSLVVSRQSSNLADNVITPDDSSKNLNPRFDSPAVETKSENLLFKDNLNKKENQEKNIAESTSASLNNNISENSKTNKPEPLKEKPKSEKTSLLSNILNNPTPSSTKAAEKIVITPMTQTKKKTNETSRAIEEKARQLKEQEKLKKEEKFKQEIQQKNNAAITSSARKNIVESEKKIAQVEREVEKQKEPELQLEEVETDNNLEDSKDTDDKVAEYKIEKFYFRVYENEDLSENKNRYSFDYLFSFRNWKICTETKLIEDLSNGHFKELRENVEEVSNNKSQNNRNDKGGFGKKGMRYKEEQNQPKISNENTAFQRSAKIEMKAPQQEQKEITPVVDGEGLGKWGRKDLTKEEKVATDFKSRREEEVKKDPIRFKLTEYIKKKNF